MRLALIVTSAQGGLLHYTVQLADGLAGRGHEVEVLAPRGNELADRQDAAVMRAVLTPPVRSTKQPTSRVAYVLRRAGIAARLTRAWIRVNIDFRRRDYDAVIVTEGLDLTLSAIAVGLMTVGARRPVVTAVCHNVRPFNRWSGGELFDSSARSLGPLRHLFPRLELVFVHGERSREEFQELWPPTRLAVIPHGDERLFADSPPAPSPEERILFFGDWRKVKGLQVLMDAFDRVAQSRPGARLTIAGAPAPTDFDPETVKRWAARHGERVEVLDEYVPLEEVRGLFGAARVVATPYLVGYQSGVLHLAQTMARPVVTSDVGDLGAAVGDGVAGRVVAPGEVDALADALGEILADPQLAERMGAAGHDRLTSAASWDTVAERVEEALRSLPRRPG